MGSQKHVSDALRRAIQKSDISRYRIAKETAVSEAVLSRFMAGQRGLSLDAVDKLSAFFGLALMPVKGKQPRTKVRK